MSKATVNYHILRGFLGNSHRRRFAVDVLGLPSHYLNLYSSGLRPERKQFVLGLTFRFLIFVGFDLGPPWPVFNVV